MAASEASRGPAESDSRAMQSTSSILEQDPNQQEDTTGEAGFRASEIAFLQEQNNNVLQALENIEDERDNTLRLVREWEDKEQQMLVETASVQQKIQVLQDALVQEKTELISKDEHVRVLSQQNQQMLELLELEEVKTRDLVAKIGELDEENNSLKVLEGEFDKIKEEIENLIKGKKEESLQTADQLREFRQLNESLRADIASVDAQTQVDIEALNQVLTVVSNKNVEYMQQLQKQDTREQHLNEELAGLRDTASGLKKEIEQMKKQMDGDENERGSFERDKASLQQKIESLESQIDVLKKTLNTAEKSNEQLHEENRRSAEKFREMADKVYGLMDSLRLNQVELKRMEAENSAKQKKFSNTEKLIANVQSKISMELDAKQIAEQEKRDADSESALLKKKNKKIEESIATAQNMQEQIGKHIVELNEQINALQTQNAYLASRIDGQEEEKSSLKGEIKKSADRFADMSKTNNLLREEIDKLDLALQDIRETTVNLRAELEYVKREDVLDETGRQRPILIQSNESTLLEKLQINEFLYEAQQNKNPVPSLVEKLAQLLELLHTAQGHCDQYLGDLAKSNSLVSALRQKNLVLFEKTSMFESYKTRALVRYMMNLFESGDHHNINLDGLNLTPRELQELTSLLQRYQIQEKVYFISLAENGLTDDAVNQLLQLVMQTPYLKALDLRRNTLTGGGIQKINDQLRVMEGVTSVIKTATGQINVHSGNQLRVCVEVADQGVKYTSEDPTEEKLDPAFNVKGADDFLGTAGGLTGLGGQDMYGKATETKAPDSGRLPAVGKAKAKAKTGAARKRIPPPLHQLNSRNKASSRMSQHGGRQKSPPPGDSSSRQNYDRFQMESQGSPTSSRLLHDFDSPAPPSSNGKNIMEGEHSYAFEMKARIGGAGRPLSGSGAAGASNNNQQKFGGTRGGSRPYSGTSYGSSGAIDPGPPRLVGDGGAVSKQESQNRPGWQASIDFERGPSRAPAQSIPGGNQSTSRTTARTMASDRRIPSERVLDKWQTGNYDPNRLDTMKPAAQRNNFVKPDSR
ncbi:unnamed protein product [Amoebophrya sp. A120]|nr:unnamed protein product [Amoebophrya sp. A120]|eukprot:GSA120T00006718001.1